MPFVVGTENSSLQEARENERKCHWCLADSGHIPSRQTSLGGETDGRTERHTTLLTFALSLGNKNAPMEMSPVEDEPAVQTHSLQSSRKEYVAEQQS